MDAEKAAILDDLSSACQHAYYLKLIAASNGLTKEVDEIETNIKSLQEQIDELRQELSAQWLVKAQKLHSGIIRNKIILEDVVVELRREIDVIENVAKGLDYFQKIVEMAARMAI